MDERKFLGAMLALRQNIALEMLTKPESRDLFAYGHAVGMQHGLQRAEHLLMEQLKDEKESDT